MADVRHSPQSEADLEAILEDLQQNAPAIAERYATAFHEKGQLLARFPEMGRARPEIAPNLRSTLVQPAFFSTASKAIPFKSFGSCMASVTCDASSGKNPSKFLLDGRTEETDCRLGLICVQRFSAGQS
jgi:plasmid stabilization system protein ParE